MLQVDLTPPQEIKRQKTQYFVGTSTKISAVLLVMCLLAAGYLAYRSLSYKAQIFAVDQRVLALESRRAELSDVEEVSKKLAGKYFLLQRYMETRVAYSSVVKELIARVPSEVTVDDIAFESGGKKANVSGFSTNPSQVAAFITELSRSGNAASDPAVQLTGKNAFTDVRLETLSVDDRKAQTRKAGSVEYAISFKINEGAFLK